MAVSPAPIRPVCRSIPSHTASVHRRGGSGYYKGNIHTASLCELYQRGLGVRSLFVFIKGTKFTN